MCARYGLDGDPEKVAKFYKDLAYASEANKNFRTWNAAPTQSLPIVVQDGERRVEQAKWGWKRDFSGSKLLVNAKGEEAYRKKTFAEAIERRRCIVPASFFFEWTEPQHGQIPYAFALKDNGVFGIAGLWEETEGDRQFLLLTVEANEIVEPIHHRMACIIPQSNYSAWIDPHSNLGTVREIIKPFPAGEMRAWRISSKVNRVENNAPEFIAPVKETGIPRQQHLFE
jgi:putative SOS response-associated peptidase YedK